MKTMVDLSCRSDEAELMDEGDLSFAEFHSCLQELETINILTLAYRPTLKWLKPFMKRGETLSIVDVGSGGGDMLRRIENASSPGKFDLIGVDLNPWSKRSARLSSSDSRVRYATADVFHFEPERSVDVVICSLFAHHLSDEQLVRFLRWMHQRAKRGWFVNDLHRHPLPYHFIKAATRLFSRNRLVRNDAAVSVARAFTRSDWQRLLAQAGLTDVARVQWYFPFRFCVSCRK